MIRSKLNQAGFEAVGVVIAVLVVAVIGYAGYKVLMMRTDTSAGQKADASSQVKVPDTIKTKADLTQTGKALDQSGGQIKSNLNDTSLDSDLNSML